MAENAKNKSSNRKITYNGITMIASDWILELGVSRSTFYRHLKKGPDEFDSFMTRYCGDKIPRNQRVIKFKTA